MGYIDIIPDYITSTFYSFLEVPNLKIRKPAIIQKPSPTFVFMIVLVSYFIVTGGVIYDVIVEPPSVGSTTDEHGHSRPVAFMPYRVNGQYIVEGLASSFLFTIGGLGFIVLEKAYDPSIKVGRSNCLIGFGCFIVFISFVAIWTFMRMKLPGYLQN